MDFADPSETDFERKSMGDWAYEQFERIPCAGDSFRYGDLRVTVAHKRQNRIMKLTAKILPPEENTADTQAANGKKPAEADRGEGAAK